MPAKGADIGSKRLISLAPQAWVRWLLDDPSVEVVDLLSAEFQWVSRESDVLLRVRRADLGEFLVLTEMQLHYRANLPRRMRAYAALAEERYKVPVYPVLVNILDPGPRVKIPTAYHSEFLGQKAHQDYQVVNLWEVDAGWVLAEKLLPLLPFVPIMRGGQETPVLERALGQLRAEPTLAEMETLLAFLATFVLDTPLIQQLMRWDMAIIRESPWYKEAEERGLELGLKEGLERGLEQGLERGLERGLKRGRRQAAEEQLLHVLAHRLGAVPADIQAAVRDLSHEQLQSLFDPALDASTYAEFRAHLPARGHQTGRPG